MKESDYKEKIALLESAMDLLESELCHIHQMLLLCGFPEGTVTLKKAMEEQIARQES